MLETLLRKLKAECSKSRGANKRGIMDIMMATFSNRRDWIMKDAPAIQKVLHVYPGLKMQSEESMSFFKQKLLHDCLFSEISTTFVLLSMQLGREFERVTGLKFTATPETWVSKQAQVVVEGKAETSRPAVRRLLQMCLMISHMRMVSY